MKPKVHELQKIKYKSVSNKLVLILVAIFALTTSSAQMLEPVKWTSKIEKKSETNYILHFDATIEKEWHMYSQFTPDGGPLPMEFDFKNQKGNFKLIGKAVESKTKTAYNDVFEVNETFFELKAHIQQEISLTNTSLKTVEVVLDYQVCKTSCINGNQKFSFAIPPLSKDVAVETPVETPIDTAQTAALPLEKPQPEITVANDISESKTPTEKPHEGKGLLTIFFLAFLGGFAALLTPCVFPMIPLTVSFFTKQSGTRSKGIANALFYAFSIIFIYVALGLLVTGIFGAEALNQLSTSVIFNLVFFVILVFFAISFLGAFEIVLPQSWANKVDAQAGKSGLVAIFFMALALAIVSFSCTGPIVGTLLVESASKGGIAPVVGMLGFSSAIALPFMLFALFPAWMNSLPKSGGWMNTVKVCLGFLELALAFKFLSNADLVLQLHWLEREVFVAIWIAIFGTWALYLFGRIALPHDGPQGYITVGRLLMGLLVLTFTIYLIPGIWGAPLKLISAFPPPIEYSESPFGLGGGGKAAAGGEMPDGAKKDSRGLLVFDDYEKGLAYAKSINKPIMLDFTGWACVNCRKMENNVWIDPRILPILKNDLVLISLYVDDKRALPKSEQTVTKDGKEIETIGDKWTEFMISRYQTNTQPLYVLTDLEGNSLNPDKPTISYVSVSEYENWLKQGLAKFKK
jgi:thiol:disulfide interchange protein